MKPIVFLGDSLDRIREFPERAMHQAGVELRQVQHGLDPSNWKPMKSIGQGAREIRVRDEASAFRILYVANLADAVYVLHAFQKKARATSKRDLTLGQLRFRLLR